MGDIVSVLWSIDFFLIGGPSNRRGINNMRNKQCMNNCMIKKFLTATADRRTAPEVAE